jgi:aspartate/methionine/tyrosine aminotransferase
MRQQSGVTRSPAGATLARAHRLCIPSARSDVPPFMAMDVMSAATRLEQEGRRIIHMEVGQPAAPAPSTAIAAARSALAHGRLGYTESLGLPSLRRRIARHYYDSYGLAVDPATVVVTTGSSAAFILAYLALLEAGDRVALAAPAYPPYRHILTALGCEPVLIATSAETRFALSPQALLAAHRERPLKAALIASPANPSGSMMSAEALADLIAVAKDAGVAIISDEIYHGLDYAFPASSALAFSDRVVVINSFSKYFCMTGWRIGWMIAPAELIRPIERLHQNLAISAPTLSQIAAEAALDGRAEMEAVKRGYAENRRLLMEGLPQAGLAQFLPVDGAFYLYADVSAFTDDSLSFAQRLLEEAGVAVTPGADFDPIAGRKFVRLCYAGTQDDVKEALARIGDWLARIGSRLRSARRARMKT